MGSVEGCFLNPIPGSTTPMLVRALGTIARRSVLFGECCVHVRVFIFGGLHTFIV